MVQNATSGLATEASLLATEASLLDLRAELYALEARMYRALWLQFGGVLTSLGITTGIILAAMRLWV